MLIVSVTTAELSAQGSAEDVEGDDRGGEKHRQLGIAWAAEGDERGERHACDGDEPKEVSQAEPQGGEGAFRLGGLRMSEGPRASDTRLESWDVDGVGGHGAHYP